MGREKIKKRKKEQKVKKMLKEEYRERGGRSHAPSWATRGRFLVGG